MDGLHLPRFGVYAVLVDVLGGPHEGRYQGAASIGTRPTEFMGNGTPIKAAIRLATSACFMSRRVTSLSFQPEPQHMHANDGRLYS